MKKHMSSGGIGCVLVAVVAWSIAGVCLTGCSTPDTQTPEEKVQARADDLRATLERAVQDVGKRRQMQALADQALIDLQAGAAELAVIQLEQERLNADYNATRDDYRKLEERLQAVRRKQVAQIVATRQALAILATDDEWQEITSRDLALLNN